MTCPNCEYHKNRAARWRAEAYKQAGHEIELPWVGLTEEDFVLVNQLCDTPIQGAEYAAHLLKEKNT